MRDAMERYNLRSTSSLLHALCARARRQFARRCTRPPRGAPLSDSGADGQVDGGGGGAERTNCAAGGQAARGGLAVGVAHVSLRKKN